MHHITGKVIVQVRSQKSYREMRLVETNWKTHIAALVS